MFIRLVCMIACLFFLLSCGENSEKENSAAEFKKKLDDNQKKYAEKIKKLQQELQQKKNEQVKNSEQAKKVDNDIKKSVQQQNDEKVSTKQEVNNKQSVGKINLFDFFLLQTQALSQKTKLKRKDSLEKLSKIANGRETKLFGVVKDVEEVVITNPDNVEEKITQYLVRFKSLIIGNKYLPFNLSFPYTSLVAETRDKSMAIGLEQGNFVSAVGHLKLQMKKNSYNQQNDLDVRFVIKDAAKGLDQTAMGLKDVNSTLTTSEIVSYMQTVIALKGTKKTFNISIYQSPLKNLGIKANFIGDFKRENLNERYRKEGRFRFLISKDIKISFQEKESLAKILLNMPKRQKVQVTGEIVNLKSGAMLDKASVYFKLNGNEYKFENGNLNATEGKLKVFDLFVAGNALFHNDKKQSLDSFYLFLETAKQVTSFVDLEMQKSNRLTGFQSVVIKLLEGNSIPYKLSKSKTQKGANGDSSWDQIQELYQVASRCASHSAGYPKELKKIAGRWSRGLRKNLFADYVYINSSSNPFLDNDMQKQYALTYPKRHSTKVVPIVYLSTVKNAYGYSSCETKLVLLEKKEVLEIEKIAKGLVKAVDFDAIQEELQTITKLCYVYQNGLGRRFRYPKNLNTLVEQGLARTDKSKKLLAKYEYMYSQISAFLDHEGERQHIIIYPKKQFRKIPVMLMSYTSKKEAFLTQKELEKVKKMAVAAIEKNGK